MAEIGPNPPFTYQKQMSKLSPKLALETGSKRPESTVWALIGNYEFRKLGTELDAAMMQLYGQALVILLRLAHNLPDCHRFGHAMRANELRLGWTESNCVDAAWRYVVQLNRFIQKPCRFIASCDVFSLRR